MYVFVYGTLKQGYGNHGVLGNSKFIGKAFTESPDYLLYDGGFPWAVYEEDKGIGRIVGEVYEIDDEITLHNLDRLEGVPYMYQHHTTNVIMIKENPLTSDLNLDGNILTVNMYVASKSSRERLDDRRLIFPSGENTKFLKWKRGVVT